MWLCLEQYVDLTLQTFIKICLPEKKYHGKVMEINCPNPPYRVPIVL